MEVHERAADGKPLEMIGIVRARNDKPSKRGGKFAFLTISDPTGELEMMVFNEGLQQFGDLLQPGKAVAITVTAKLNGEELRLNLDRAVELEAARLSKPSGSLMVRLGPDASPDDFAGVIRRLEQISDGERGAIYVELILSDGRKVSVRLPQTYTIGLRAQRALKEVPGVEKVDPRQAA